MSGSGRLDALIIGSGEGGKYLAWHLGRSGERVAVVERRWIGGSCPNINCLPSKNEIHSAHVAHLVHHAAAYGVTTGATAVDMERVRARKREMVDGLVATHRKLYADSGVELIMGQARILPDHRVEVSLNDGGSRILAADKLFLNLGTHAAIPDIPGLAQAQPLTHIEALELGYVPRHLIVLGGGYVGLELAQAHCRFGAQVTILEGGPQIASREDPDVAAALLELMRDEGADVRLGTHVRKVSGQSGEEVVLELETRDGISELRGSDILVATGRIPNTDGIGLEEASIQCDARGFIVVNEHLETTAPKVWAIGEACGSPQFTHASYDDFRVIRDNLAGGRRSTRDRLMPYVMYTEPPLGRVGLSEGEAARRGIAVRTASLPIGTIPRARTLSETRGFMKAVVSAEDDSILGFTMFGPEAGEVMTIVQTAMTAGLPYSGLRDVILSHPTMAEGLTFLLGRIPAR